MKARRTALAAALAMSALPASAVTLSNDGYGQALIFPYYTVRASEGGNAFNTYLSVGNRTSDAKAVRVRIREGRAGREVLGFNLYLSPNDIWTGALVPTGAGARLITADNSCTDPAFGAQLDLPLHSNGYTGTNADGLGDTLDRTREGYVEMIEMATVTGQARDNVIHRATGLVTGCGAMRADPAPTVAAPSGGLWGGLTLINVNSGQDFMLEATALDRLATRPYFRPPADPYPDFDAAEIDPVSVVVANGKVYRSVWSQPRDAVSATLMRESWMGEYILDNATASLTDFVVTSPTRRLHLAGQPAPPFTTPPVGCWVEGNPRGQLIQVVYANRSERTSTSVFSDIGGFPNPPMSICTAVAVASTRNPAAVHMPPDTTRSTLFGSTALGLIGGHIPVTAGFQSGWLTIRPASIPMPTLASLASSTVTTLATGATVAGPHTFVGMPVIGFSARTFRNGTLSCASGSCQGNYGGAFPLKYRRNISP